MDEKKMIYIGNLIDGNYKHELFAEIKKNYLYILTTGNSFDGELFKPHYIFKIPLNKNNEDFSILNTGEKVLINDKRSGKLREIIANNGELEMHKYGSSKTL